MRKQAMIPFLPGMYTTKHLTADENARNAFARQTLECGACTGTADAEDLRDGLFCVTAESTFLCEASAETWLGASRTENMTTDCGE